MNLFYKRQVLSVNYNAEICLCLRCRGGCGTSKAF
jgi:hypothetical protein